MSSRIGFFPCLARRSAWDGPADIVGLLAVLDQERILLLPVCLIGRPLLLPPLGPRQPRFRLFSHLLSPPIRLTPILHTRL